LRFINSLKDSSVGRLFRWSLHIQGFDFEIIYVKGSQHYVADGLSRRDYPLCTDNTMDKLFLNQSVHLINQKPRYICQECKLARRDQKEYLKADISRVSSIRLEVHDGFGHLTDDVREAVWETLIPDTSSSA